MVMKGSRSKDNCYLWIYQNREDPLTCLMSKIDETKLWHQKIGDFNLKSIKKIVFREAIKVFPNMLGTEF